MFFAELNEMLTRELAEDGYSGVEVRVTPLKTEIIIRATRTQSVLGACSRRPFLRSRRRGSPCVKAINNSFPRALLQARRAAASAS